MSDSKYIFITTPQLASWNCKGMGIERREGEEGWKWKKLMHKRVAGFT